MMEFKSYLDKKLKNDPKLSKDFWKGYEEFKIGVILREERLKAGMTQEEIAIKINTTKSVISRIENHAEDIRLSTLGKFAEALGKNIKVILA